MSSKDKNIRVKVTLTSKGNGILMNPMTDDLLDELAGVAAKKASDKDTPLADRAAKKVIRDENGKIGLPVEYILAALIGAGRHVKSGKKQISTATTTSLYEFLEIDQTFLPFANQENNSWTVDKRRGVLNNAGKSVAVAIIRPKFKTWETTFEISIDTTVMDEKIVKQVFEAAGAKIGVGDFRPSKRGPFGMFIVSAWEVVS
jgi:hypothetical protein